MKRPFFLLLIFIILSIVLTKQSDSIIISAIIISGIFLLYFLLKKYSLKSSGLFIVFIISIGFICYTYFIINYDYDLKKYENKKVDLYLHVIYPPSEKSGYRQIYSKVYAIDDNTRYKPISQKVLLNIYGEKSFDIKPGQKYKVSGKVLLPKSSNADSEFDYNLYLKSKRVYSIIKVSDRDIQYISDDNLFLCINKIYDLKDSIAKKLNAYIPAYEADVICSILWGDELADESFSDDLTAIGANHILSVSGLHVGYIYLLMTFLLKRTKASIKLQTVVVLSVLLVYAAMCAFSVSIIRACVMFAVIQCCKIYKKLYDPLSSLSFAAIVILIFNPLCLFTASFQLSFAAMAGIIFFARIINNKTIQIRPKILKTIIQLISLTICVQLATLPIILYHFSAISLISVFSNTVIIPLTGLIVISAFLGMFLCFLPFMQPFFVLLSYEIKSLIFFADLFSKANYANISLNKMFLSEIIAFYILLFIMFGYIDKHNKKAIYLCAVSVLACAVYSFIKAAA